jgi:ABC-type nitrate/sulfonate/bicarbonate transport system substrate-binding protein
MRPLTVSLFPNAKALPLWACVEAGIAAEHGLDLTLHETGSSAEQRDALASGRVHIVQAAVDNAVEMKEAGVDVVIFMGGEGGMNDLIAQPTIGTIRDLAGKRLAVDSPHTAYALLARDLLARHGLQLGEDYTFHPVGNGGRRLKAMTADPSLAAAVLNPPFTAMAVAAGMHVLASMDEPAGPYQAGGGFALRAWLEANADLAVDYIRTYLSGLAWMHGNPVKAVDLLCRRLSLSREIATATYGKLCDPVSGFEPAAKLNHEGLANVLRIRARANGVQPAFALDDYMDERAYVNATDPGRRSGQRQG